MSSPDLYIKTSFILTDAGCILSTREPQPQPGPLLTIVKGKNECRWATRASLPDDLKAELDHLARQEPAATDFRDVPIHAERYKALLREHLKSQRPSNILRETSGPTFTFPDNLSPPADIAFIHDEALLQRNFHGWIPGEIAAGRAPVAAIVRDGYPVSICFCARFADAAAEAGLETATALRGQGFAAQVTAAWAIAIRALGRVPLYSTFWSNDASRAVARKLELVPYAGTWSLCD